MSLEILVKPIVAEAIKRGFSALEKYSGSNPEEPETIAPALGEHLQMVANWSTKVQFFEMAESVGVDNETIPLALTSIPRKFRGSGSSVSRISELEMLGDASNIILLGDPGSGKTTSLKRVALRLLRGESNGETEPWQYPAVVLLREVQDQLSIVPVLAKKLGIPFVSHATWHDNTTGHEYEPDDVKGVFSQQYMEENMTPRFHHLMADGRQLVNALAKFLDESGALVLLDGLDEVPRENQAALAESIRDLTRRLARSKVILSCRSGDYQENFEGFRALEICGLDPSQISAIVTRWLTDGKAFLARIRGTRLEEFSERPLFLCHLIVLYRNTGDLPERPISIYQKLVRLLLEDWDRHRGISRGSRYAGFGPDAKLEFLAALSYELTYVRGVSRFDNKALLRIYRRLCEKFALPLDEAREVAIEIESHTGLIVESGVGFFQFSHLTFQEFLAGYYIIRRPFDADTRRNTESSAGPVALAVCLSSEPSEWFAQLFLGSRFFWDVTTVTRLAARLRSEHPLFTRNEQLGLAIMRIVLEFGVQSEKSKNMLEVLLEIEGVAESVRSVLSRFELVSKVAEQEWRVSAYTSGVMITGALTLAAIEIMSKHRLLSGIRFDEERRCIAS